MISSFYKYQSIGNDFIIVDMAGENKAVKTFSFASAPWKSFVQDICKRNTGVGADCLLVITERDNVGIRLLVFNADGTQAENCLNGVRCIAHYFFSKLSDANEVYVRIGSLSFHCKKGDLISQKALSITTKISLIQSLGRVCAEVDKHSFNGWSVSVGNPHFVVCSEQNAAWLKAHGESFQKLTAFPEGVNIEFIWEESFLHFNLIVFERGCGLTNGCSSGIVAAAFVLREKGCVDGESPITIIMPGGRVKILYGEKGAISLNAISHFVFNGSV